MPNKSTAESQFIAFWSTMCRVNRMKNPVLPTLEHVFAPPRKWRFDFAWVDYRVAVEMEGGAWVGGRHVRPAGFQADMAKYNRASASGWRVLRFTPQMLKDDPQGCYEDIIDSLNESILRQLNTGGHVDEKKS